MFLGCELTERAGGQGTKRHGRVHNGTGGRRRYLKYHLLGPSQHLMPFLSALPAHAILMRSDLDNAIFMLNQYALNHIYGAQIFTLVKSSMIATLQFHQF